MRPVVVIGAGPYGLSAAAHLKARGVAVRIFGTPMSSWSGTMPRGMVLKSTPDASTISAPGQGHTLQDFCDAIGEPRPTTERDLVSLDLFVRYGRWFAERLVPEVEQAQVASVDRHGGQFHLKLDSGEELAAPAVVVASGLSGFAYLPPELRILVPDGPGPGPADPGWRYTAADLADVARGLAIERLTSDDGVLTLVARNARWRWSWPSALAWPAKWALAVEIAL